jgi:hypothetical protein
MSLNIIQELQRMSSSEAARLIGSAPQYIKNDNLINILNQYNYNFNSKNKNDVQNNNRLIQQINMFTSIPGIKQQVSEWLNS